MRTGRPQGRPVFLWDFGMERWIPDTRTGPAPFGAAAWIERESPA